MPITASSTATVASMLKVAMRQMPSPVAIVSAIDPKTSSACGMAVTAYMPVSMDPPSMQICINRSASAYDAILDAKRFSINVLGINCSNILEIFSDPSKKIDRFSHDDWKERSRVPYLANANSVIFCTIAAISDFGTHSLIVGLVDEVVHSGCSVPAVWLESHLCPVKTA